jgi:hypothetical protein
MNKGGNHYEKLSSCKDFAGISFYLDREEFEKAYEVANKNGIWWPCELTLYLIKEHGEVFHYDPLYYLNRVPQNYLYEAYEPDLVVLIPYSCTEIADNAFRYASIKRLIIPKSIEKIGESALCLNKGTIEYEGTKEEFIRKFLGKSNCFLKTTGKTLICSDGEILVE